MRRRQFITLLGAPICEWRFVGVAATSIGHRFLPKSWSPYSRM
jgi:hypothetical protein